MLKPESTPAAGYAVVGFGARGRAIRRPKNGSPVNELACPPNGWVADAQNGMDRRGAPEPVASIIHWASGGPAACWFRRPSARSVLAHGSPVYIEGPGNLGKGGQRRGHRGDLGVTPRWRGRIP